MNLVGKLPKNFSSELVGDLEAHGRLVSLVNGETVFSEGDSCENFLIVLEGEIKVSKHSAEGKEAVLYSVDSNNLCVITISCLLGARAYNAFGAVDKDTEALVISGPDFHRMLGKYDEFREFIFSSLSGRLFGFLQKIDDLIFLTMKERLINLIGQKSSQGRVDMTHQQLATELGTSREVVSRHVKSLEKEGFLKIERGSLVLVTNS